MGEYADTDELADDCGNAISKPSMCDQTYFCTDHDI